MANGNVLRVIETKTIIWDAEGLNEHHKQLHRNVKDAKKAVVYTLLALALLPRMSDRQKLHARVQMKHNIDGEIIHEYYYLTESILITPIPYLLEAIQELVNGKSIV